MLLGSGKITKNNVIRLIEHERECKGMSMRACTKVWGLAAKVFVSFLPESAKQKNVNSKLGLSVSTTFDCPYFSNCIHTRAKVSFVGPHYLPKFWGKKPKATTKMALTSHQ